MDLCDPFFFKTSIINTSMEDEGNNHGRDKKRMYTPVMNMQSMHAVLLTHYFYNF